MALWFSFFRGNPGSSADPLIGGGVPHWVSRVEKEPDDPFVRRRAGEELLRLGDPAGAMGHWLKAADLYLAAGCALRALGVLAPALRVDPASTDVRARLAAMAREQMAGAPAGSSGSAEDQGAGEARGGGHGCAEVCCHGRTPGESSSRLGRVGPSVPLFSEFEACDLETVAANLEVRQFVAGEILLRENEVAGGLAILIDGVVRILARTDGQRATKIGSLRPGDLFGLGSALDGLASAATLAAEEPGELLVWPRAALEAICRERPRLREVLDAFRRGASPRGMETSPARLRTGL